MFVHVQQGAGVEFVGQGFAQGGALVLLALAGQRGGARGLAGFFMPGAGFERLHGADGAQEKGVVALPLAGLCLQPSKKLAR